MITHRKSTRKPIAVNLLLDVLMPIARLSHVRGVALNPYFVMFSRIKREFVAKMMTTPRLMRPACCCLVIRSDERYEYFATVWTGCDACPIRFGAAVGVGSGLQRAANVNVVPGKLADGAH
jgi:hypothetical protein